MSKSSGISRWWDWPSIAVLFVLLQTVASRLVTTAWTPFLFITQTVTYIGIVVGTALGYTRFSPLTARWLSFVYMLIMLPLQWTLMMAQETSLEEQWMSLGGRLFFSFSDFFARRPVEDPLFFVVLVSIAFWIISASAGFNLVRRQNYLAAVIPSAVGLLIIQNYDNFIAAGRVWFLAFFSLMALLLLGRLHFLENKQSWRERRVFLSPDNSIDLTSTMAIAAGLIILVAWTVPASLSSLDSAVRTWNKITRPWREFTEQMENAVSALESPSGGKRGEFFGPELALGRGFPLSDMVMFRVQIPDLPTEEKPPHYYWRGRTYDYYVNGQWYITGAELVEYSPAETLIPPTFPEGAKPMRFLFNTGDVTYSLIYAPPQPVWLNRQGSTLNLPADTRDEIVSWYAYPALFAGETYQVDAILSNPNIQQLREAGTTYPAWVAEKYLQLPEKFPPKIQRLALEITAGSDNPYDKAFAVTKYLRDNIKYSNALPRAPRNKDLLEWVLFDHKEAYCVYYASSEILMLRSIGIPARLAVGFAQGEQDGDSYTVRKLDAHAWPEVYFPAIGWVEFEPTGSQPALNRPLPSNDEQNNFDPALLNPLGENNQENLRGFQEEEDVAVPDQVTVTTVRPSLYLIPILIIFLALTIYFSRRYSVPARIPVLLRTTLERNGTQAPRWVINWEHWISLSATEKAFESINFGLRLLEQPAPIDATPIERAKALTNLLPRLENQIKTLLDEHQTSLYTSQKADEALARRAAFSIRIQALIERVRYTFEGNPARYQ